MQDEDANDQETSSDELVLLEKGMLSLFSNDFDGAESIFKAGFEGAPPSKRSKLRDIRPVFGFLNALLSASVNLAAFGKSQMKETLKRLQAADHLAKQSDDWVGRKIVRGLSLASIGALEIAQHKYVKGVMTLGKSTKYLKAVKKEGLKYNGPEAVVIRSASLLCLGVLQILYSFLGDTTGKVAKWLSGFPGDREQGIGLLVQCFREKGVFAPWAAIGFVMLQTDTSTFIAETIDKDQRELAGEMMAWAKEKYETSAIFTVCEMSLAEIDRNLGEKFEMIREMQPHFQLPALKLVFKHKQGVMHWSLLEFGDAARSFKESMDLLMSIGQRGMVPYNAFCAFISYLQQLRIFYEMEEIDAAVPARMEKTVGRLIRVFDWCLGRQDKSWGPADLEVFSVLPQYILPHNDEDKGPDGKVPLPKLLARIQVNRWVLLDIAELMAFDVRCSYFMTPSDIDILIGNLSIEQDTVVALSSSDILRLHTVLVEFYLQKGDAESAKKELEAGLSFANAKNTSKAEAKEIIPYKAFLYYFQAKLNFDEGQLELAQKFLKSAKSLGNTHKYHNALNFKFVVLGQKISETYSDDYLTVNVGPRGRATLIVDLGLKSNQSKLQEKDGLLKYTMSGDFKHIKVELRHSTGKKKSKARVLEKIQRIGKSKTIVGGVEDLPKTGQLWIVAHNSSTVGFGKKFRLKLAPDLECRAK